MNANEKEKLPFRNVILNDDQIDLRKLYNTLVRKKLIVFSFALSGLLFGSLYSFQLKEIWQGEFQIVLPSESSGDSAGIDNFQSLFSLASMQNDSLATDIEILKSPSVLMPVFKYVKDEKSKLGQNIDNWRFRNWSKDKLEIGRQAGTSVLNISYKDSDKSLILPVLDKISYIYQSYSSKKQLSKLEEGLKYIEEQIERYKEVAFSSLESAQEFAINNDLLYPAVLAGRSLNETEPFLNTTESIRVEAINSLKKIEVLNKNLQDTFDLDEIFSVCKAIHNFFEQGNTMIDKIDVFNRELAEVTTYFKDDDYDVRNLKLLKVNYTNKLKEDTFSLLKAQEIANKSTLASSTRSISVLTKYKELILQASNAEATLRSLEQQFIALSLSKAQSKEIGELITTPTILDKPVAPNRTRIIFIFVVMGFILGSIAAVIYEQKKKIIFDIDELRNIFKQDELMKFTKDNRNSWNEYLNLLARGPLMVDPQLKIALIPIGDLDEGNIIEFKNQLQLVLSRNEIIVTKDILESKDCSRQLLMASNVFTTAESIIETQRKLKLQGSPVVGWIYIDQKNINSDL